jgi:hypothetical protein
MMQKCRACSIVLSCVQCLLVLVARHLRTITISQSVFASVSSAVCSCSSCHHLLLRPLKQYTMWLGNVMCGHRQSACSPATDLLLFTCLYWRCLTCPLQPDQPAVRCPGSAHHYHSYQQGPHHRLGELWYAVHAVRSCVGLLALCDQLHWQCVHAVRSCVDLLALCDQLHW